MICDHRITNDKGKYLGLVAEWLKPEAKGGISDPFTGCVAVSLFCSPMLHP